MGKDNGLIACKGFYEESTIFRCLAYLTISSVIFLNAYVMRNLVKNIKSMSVRQRAPVVAVVHLWFYLMAIFIPLTVEIFLVNEVFEWERDDVKNPGQIPTSRYVVKFIMCYCRFSLSMFLAMR